jgi:calcineurin-like phosphoesterase family protein
MAIYFTSDTHFGHANIIKYANRPFSNCQEMDDVMIRRWNSVVKPGDTVYHLGDFSMGKLPADDYVKELHGVIHLIIGNHETKALKSKLIQSISPLLEIDVGAQRFVLCHYAMRVWNKSHHGSWHLYGHSHGTLPDDAHSNSFDIGVDCWNFYPVSVDQIRNRMSKKRYQPVDHHNSETVKKESGVIDS